MFVTSIDLPLSKSLINRALILIAGQGQLTDWLLTHEEVFTHGCRDTRLLIQALQERENQTLTHFEFQDAGTPCRLFTAFAAANFQGPCEIRGNDSLNRRSIEPLVSALQMMGAEIQYLEKEGFTPILIKKGIEQWKDVRISVAMSSQFASALILIAPIFSGIKTLILTDSSHSHGYLEMTMEMLKQMGVEVSSKFIDDEIHVEVRGEFNRSSKTLPHNILASDWSSAAFFYPLLLGLPMNTALELRGLSMDNATPSKQSDAALCDLGRWFDIETRASEFGVIIAKQGSNFESEDSKKFEFSPAPSKGSTPVIHLKNHPDLVPALIVGWCIRGEKMIIEGIHNLRYKECDRIAAMQENIKPLGCTLTQVGIESEDKWILDCSQRIFPSQMHIETRSDHRIAMAFSALKHWIPNLTFSDTHCVEKSFPQFWEQWKKCTFE